jgi:hypothetical protein
VGVGGSPKRLALKRLFGLIKPYLVLIQETMCEASEACEVFLKKISSLEVCGIDVVGFSSGLLAI